MTITIFTDHANELIRVDDVLDAGGSAVVALGLVNQDGSDTFPGARSQLTRRRSSRPASPRRPLLLARRSAWPRRR
ncbi:MAG: hypothetical protein ACLP01_19680 [Solirubrobacteraceae bacterium]